MFSKYIADLLSIFYPKTCLNCSKHLSYQQEILCTHCLHDLPYTYYTNSDYNLLHTLYYGKLQLNSAYSLLTFQSNGPAKKLIHELKYKNNEQVGDLLGELICIELKKNNDLKDIDYIIPVPIHPIRLKQRGYNQLSRFGLKISQILKIPYKEGVLIKTGNLETQTKKNKMARWINSQHSFQLTDLNTLKNKHILLIDDVITTGATIEACCQELLKTKNLNISIATMAHTINF